MRGSRRIALGLALALLGGAGLVAAEVTPASAVTWTETTGGAANTWTNYTNAGGTQGPTIPAFASVQITCRLTGFRVADGNTWWYQIASAPWSNIYYVSADAFYNNGQTSGSLIGTPFVDTNVALCSSLTGGVPETTGGAANTWTNYLNAGGTQGPTIAARQTVQIACRVTGFRVADGNTWWYRIASAPWTNLYYVSADAFYNNGQTSGSLIGTPFVDPAVPLCSGSGGGSPGTGISERQGHYGVNTFANYQNASGLGTRIQPGATVQVSCKVYAPTIASVNPDGYWYRIASSPWNNQYYAPANTFMNGDPWGGPYSHNTDFSVPDCTDAPRPGTPTVTLAKGPAAPAGFRYAITLSSFPANSSVLITCYDSVSTRGFYSFRLSTNGSGAASTQSYCYSGDGPQHWVVANSAYASNRVSWGSGGGGSTGGINSPRAGNQGSTPPKSHKSTACNTPRPVNCASGNFWHTFEHFSVPGRGVPLNYARTYSSSRADTSGRLGFGWTDTYNMSLVTNNTTTVTVYEENGATVTFVADGNGTFTAPPFVLATLVWNADGTYTFTRLRTHVKYVFSQYGQLVRQIDRNGYVTTLEYTGSQLSRITDPGGRSLTLSYDGSLVDEIHDPLGRTVRFAYDTAGNMVSATEPAGGVWSFTYDTSHLMLSMTDPRGGATTNVYDSAFRVTKQTDPVGGVTTWAYTGDNTSTTGGTTLMTDPNGGVTRYSYQSLMLQSVTHAYGTATAATTSYTYDPATLGIATATDPNGHVTSLTYDARSNVLSKTDALNHTTSYTYNTFNHPLTETDPLGRITTYVYDTKGNLLTKTGPLGDVTTYGYGDASHPGDITNTTDPDGRVATYTYDGAGGVATKSVQRAPGIVDTTSSTYNANGQEVCKASPKAVAQGVTCPAAGMPRVAKTASTIYGLNGKVASITDPNGQTTSYTYDANGNRTSETDASGHTTTFEYDADNRLTKTTKPTGQSESTGYDGNSNAISMTDPQGRVTTNAFDARNRQIATTNPLGKTTTTSYDPAGNKTSVVDPDGRTTTLSYDAADQLTNVSYSDGTTANETYGYDAAGRRTAMNDGSGTTTYGYDELGRLVSTRNGAGATLGYSYDLAGNVVSIRYPNGKAVTRTFDGAGNLTAVKDWLNKTTTFAYDANGNVITQTAGSTPAVIDTFTYDDANRLSGNDAKVGSTTLQSFSYARTPTGLVSSTTPNGAAAINYEYDDSNQLTRDVQGTYTYDPSGNATKLLATKVTYNTGDQLTAKGTLKFSYDGQGNRTAQTPPNGVAATYNYDQANRLTGYHRGTVNAAYAYNGDDLRTSKTVGSVRTDFTWDTSGSLPLLLVDGNTNYIYGPDGAPIESITKSGTVRYLHHDQLGSTTLVTSVKGAKVTTFTYASYGKRRTGSAAASLLQFGGQYLDKESGLYYMRARYYDPTYGGFVTVDPVLAKTRDAYGYAQNNPVNAKDPSGLFAVYVCFAGEIHVFLGVSGQFCRGSDTTGNEGWTIMAGAGVGVGGGLGAIVLVTSSNLTAGFARSLDATAAYGCGGGVSYDPDQVVAHLQGQCTKGIGGKATVNAGFSVSYTSITARGQNTAAMLLAGPNCGFAGGGGGGGGGSGW